MEELPEGIGRIGGEGGEVNVIFNNNFENQGQRNAANIIEALGEDAVPAGDTFGGEFAVLVDIASLLLLAKH